MPPDTRQADADRSEAPLIVHLVELRRRLIASFFGLIVAVGICFVFADTLFVFLLQPYERALGGAAGQLIYTAPQEFFFTQIKLALFGGFILAFPFIAMQVYRFIAPGLYRNERRAFLPFLVISPVLFVAGAALVYYGVMPLALHFFLSMEVPGGGARAAITMLPRVSEYLSLAMTLIIAFGLCFQLPVVLTLLARAGLVRAQDLRRGRKYALVGIFAVAALLTPPDIVSQIGLALPTLLLYEISIIAAARAERRADTKDESESTEQSTEQHAHSHNE